MLHALVLDATLSTGAPGLGSEPITTARLRDDSGVVHVVRVVGGPNRFGGVTRIAGMVVPIQGARVRLDLAEETKRSWVPGTPPGTWATVPVAFTLALPLSRDLGAETPGEVDVALRVWPRVACTSFRTRFVGTAALTPADDGTSGVFWHDDAWPAELLPGALAQTILHTDANGRLRDADIHVNGVEHRWSTDGGAGTIDARGVLVHELGHALGLGHTDVARSTMVASHLPGLAWRSLEKDDRAGVCALYPGTGAAGCDTCPAGFVCVARECERLGSRGVVCAPCTRAPGACEGAGDDARCNDVPEGRVCGRACATDDDCGPRFRCAPTTSSGDVQCVATERCATNPCQTDGDCGGFLCKSGACVGPGEPIDAGADAAPDSGPVAVTPPSGGCSVGGASAGPVLPWLAMVLTCALRRKSKPRAP